jgi:DNA-directed RNA polymerase subunit H (RpoH/RPB5)
MVGGSNEPVRAVSAGGPNIPPGPRRSPEVRMTPSPRPRARSSSRAKAPPPPPRPFVAHHLAPLHEILTEAESTKVLGEVATPLERLPKILVTDPGLQTDPKYIALKESGERLVGRLVRIRRPSATAGEAIAYRVIVLPVREE